jgi:hypothetical protein
MKRMNSMRPAGGQPAGSSSAASGSRRWRDGEVSSGGAPVGGAVAVLAVVEGLERAGADHELLAVGEALLAEEALVEGVVEALDRAVTPRLAGRDEHRGGALV